MIYVVFSQDRQLSETGHATVKLTAQQANVKCKAWPHHLLNLLYQGHWLLMIFNLLPLGPLAGHYIVPYLLPSQAAKKYTYYNARYGNYLFLGLIILSLAGIPIFSFLIQAGRTVLPLIVFV